MYKAYWALNVVILPIVAIYVCYVAILNEQWELSLLLLLLSVTSVANYCKAYGEPNIRARENSYQDDYINRALDRISALEQELSELKREMSE